MPAVFVRSGCFRSLLNEYQVSWPIIWRRGDGKSSRAFIAPVTTIAIEADKELAGHCRRVRIEIKFVQLKSTRRVEGGAARQGIVLFTAKDDLGAGQVQPIQYIGFQQGMKDLRTGDGINSGISLLGKRFNYRSAGEPRFGSCEQDFNPNSLKRAHLLTRRTLTRQHQNRTGVRC